MDSNENDFHELSFYTLSHPDQAYFIHQHIVDAYFAQKATKDSKSIGITFALVGLYLFLEKSYTGKQVQHAHMKLAKNKKQWPHFILPQDRGKITVADILVINPGIERDKMIKLWCISVWNAFKENHKTVAELLEKELGI